MKHATLYKIALFFFIGTAFMFTSCSKDDDNNNGGGNGGQTIDPPFEAVIFDEAMTLPSNLHPEMGQTVENLIYNFDETVSFQDNADLMTIPPGSEVSHEEIVPGTLFPRSTESTSSIDYTVYTYSYGSGSIAYQYSVQNGMNVLEIFISTTETDAFIKMFEITQAQDGLSGTMTFFMFGTAAQTWTWQINADGSIFIVYDFGTEMYQSSIELLYYPDMSGNMKLYTNGALTQEFNWDSTGSGTYTNYETGETVSW